jgi:hypothetical protein
MDVEFPDADKIEDLLAEVTFPRFTELAYEPPTPECEDVPGAARDAVAELDLSAVPEGGTVAVGLGSRGIEDVVPVGRAVVAAVRDRGYEPVVLPAMGSHGGATAAGQRETLAALGIDEESLSCPVDPRMDVRELGTSASGNPVFFSEAALEADGVVVVNRVKPHTNFSGPFESGLVKMTAVGLGKQPGAQAIHERSLVAGYVDTLRDTFEVIRDEADLLGGVAIVENFHDRTAAVEGIAAADLPEAEGPLLERAREYMPTLPYEDLDVLVVDEIGKDVSGAGMDTNVVGRYRVLNTDDPDSPDIKRIVVRGLTEATHGHGQGIGLADVTTTDVVAELDLDKMYTNAITSSSLSKIAIPLALPDDEQALTAALTTVGPYDPEEIRVAWIRDTGHLSELRVSPALAAEAPEHAEAVGEYALSFEDGDPVWEDVEGNAEAEAGAEPEAED